MPGIFGVTDQNRSCDQASLLAEMAGRLRHHSWYREHLFAAEGIGLGRVALGPATAATFGSPARTIVAGVSYECRGRDRIPGAKLSEHAHANALDPQCMNLSC